MKISTTIFFIVLFGVVLTIYFLTRSEKTNTEPQIVAIATESDRVFQADEKTPIVWFQIQNRQKKETLTMEVRDGDWAIKFPVGDDADDEIVKRMLQMLRSAKREKIYLPEKDWEEYGLSNPKMKIGVETLQSSGRRYLNLGDISPVDKMMFARWEDEKGYFLIEPQFIKPFLTSLYAVREKKIFRNFQEMLSKIVIQSEARFYEISLNDGSWVWTKPDYLTGKEISPEEMEELIHQLRFLFIKDYVDETADGKKDYAFTATGPYVRVWNESGASNAVYFGGELSARDAYYARREGEKQVVLVDRQRIRSLLELIVMMSHNQPLLAG